MAIIEWQPTADACEYAALYGSTPAQIGDPDARLVYDETVALPAIDAAMRTLADITRAGTRLEDERDGLTWGFVLTLENQRQRLLKRADQVSVRIGDLNDELGRPRLSADATGLELIDTQLHDLVDEGERLLERGEAFSDLHDAAATLYEDMTGKAWTPKFGSKRRGKLFLGAAELDAREYHRATDRKSAVGRGMRIMFTAGSHTETRLGGERTWAPAPEVIGSAVMAVHAAHPDMVIVTRTADFGDKRIVNWAKKNGIATEHITDAGALRRARIAGHVHFRSPAMEGNEAERDSIREAIPVIAVAQRAADRLDNAAITDMARDFLPRENPIAELEQFYERLIGAAFRMRSEARHEKVLAGRMPAYADVMEQLKTLRLHRDLPGRYAVAIDNLVSRSREEVRDPDRFFRAPATTAEQRSSGARRPVAEDARPLPDLATATANVEALFRHLRDATRDGTQLADERDGLMWGVVNTFDRWHERVAKRDGGDDILPVVAHLRAAAIAEYERIARSPWQPRAGVIDQAAAAITYGQQRGNEFLRALEQAKSPEEHEGPIVAVFGPMLPVDDADDIPSRAAVYSALDAVLEKHPDVGIAITDAKGTTDVVRSWAQRHNLPVFVARTNWKLRARAPYDRNRSLVRLPLTGAVHFRNRKTESGITSNLVDLLRERRIPIMAVEPAAEIREAAAAEQTSATTPLTLDEHCGLLAANIDHCRARALDGGMSLAAIPGYRETIRTAERLLAEAKIPEPYRVPIGEAVTNYDQECADPAGFAEREAAVRVRASAGRKVADSQRTVRQPQKQTQNQSRGMRI